MKESRWSGLLASVVFFGGGLNGGCAADTGAEGRPQGGSSGQGGGSGKAGSGGSSGGGTSGSAGASASGGTAGSSGSSGSGGSSGSSGSAGSGGTSGSSGSGSGGTGANPPAGFLLFDDFEDGDAKGWISDVNNGNDVGNWAVVAGMTSQVYKQQTEYSDPSWAVGGDLAWTDQVVETKLQFTSSSAGDPVGYLAARLQSKDRYYFLEFHSNATNGSIKVRKRVDGSTTDLITSTKLGKPIIVGTWYTIGLSVVGTTLTASFDGNPVGTATDSALTNGGMALGIVDAVAEFDDVKVTAAP